MAKRRRRGLGSAPEAHAGRVAEIHGQIEQHLREMRPLLNQPKLRQTVNGCRIFFDGVRALQERIGRAQGHLDGVAGSPSATTAMFKTQKRLASKVGSLATSFRGKCVRSA